MTNVPRHETKNVTWSISKTGGTDKDFRIARDDAALCVLMDIRDELQRLNSRLYCPSVTDIPIQLRKIAAHADRIKPRVRKKK